jgi:acyl-CoA hydrolase
MTAGLEALWRELRPGRTVFLPGTTGESLALAETLRADPGRAHGVRFLTALVPGMNEALDYAGLAPGSSVTTFMLPGALRASFAAGRVDLVPRTYWGAARQIAAATCDVALAQVCPPDASGRCSLGLASDFTPLAWERAAFKVLLVNPQLPALPGALSLPHAAADLVITLEGPVVEAPAPGAVAHEADALAARVAELIPDGAALQTGIGGAPGALWRHLIDHRGLRLYSGMANDWLLELLDAGALAPEGGHVAGIAYGTATFYERLARTELVRFASVPETHGLPALAQVPALHSVNSALEVDLFGQVNVEWQGTALSSGVGGGPDFMRGAMVSDGGRSIIALPATARRGSVSRVVTRLDRPTTGIARCDVDTVVTEHGVADLREKGMDARAEAMIAIAAPEFRDGLAEDWRRLRATFG